MRNLALDNETHLITREHPLPRLVCTSYYDGTGESGLLRQSDYLRLWWRETLLDENIQIIGKSVCYDLGTAMMTYPELTPLIFIAYEQKRVTDVSIRQLLWDIAVGRVTKDDKTQIYSLDNLAQLILDHKPMKGKDGSGWRLRYKELENVPLKEWPADAVNYAKNDSVVTWQIWNAQNEVQSDIHDEHNMTYTEFCLSLISARGMVTNPEAVARTKAHFEDIRNNLVPELMMADLLRMKKDGTLTKPRKTAQERIAKAAQEKGIKLKLTDGGNIPTDKVACLMTGDPLMLKRAEYATAEKMLSTYIPTLEQGYDLPVTSRFFFAGTSRTTSGTPRLPLVGNNFQNAPKKGGIRECYIPRPGFVFIGCDYSSAELHTLAQTCKDKVGYSVLGDNLNNGIDVHLFVGAQLLGIDYEESKRRYDSGDVDVKKARQDAKAANFGFPGGMQEYTFYITQIKQAERFWEFDDITKLKNAWFAALPEMEQYFNYCKSEIGPSGGAVISLPTGMLRKVGTFTQLANTNFQGTAAAGAREALNAVTLECYADRESPLYGSRPVNFVHDEIVLEAPLRGRELHEVASRLSSVMAQYFNRYCPDYPTEAEPVIMKYWSKKAEPCFDEKGRLIPWPVI